MTDEAAFLRIICEHPEQDTPRLVYCDWLEQEGQCERAEFIRVGCELAKCACEMIAAGVCLGCKNCHKLRRRERELLAQTHPETCGRCKGERQKLPCVCNRCGRKENRKSWSVQSRCQRCQGSMRREDGLKWQFSIVCEVCHNKPMQVSNAVRWAGKLGGRETALLMNDPWHVGWILGANGESRNAWAYARFVRGFIGVVSLSCAALVGEPCPSQSGERRPRHNATGDCLFCHGSGRVGGLREELRRFPLTEVRLSDKRPRDDGGFGTWIDETYWIGLAPRGQNPAAPSVIPSELFSLIEAREWPNGHKQIEGSAAAESALSAAARVWVAGVQQEVTS